MYSIVSRSYFQNIFLVFACVAILIFPAQATSQQLPAYRSLTVSDLAEVIDPETEARLDALLDRLRRERGIEMTVVTIRSRRDHGDWPSIEAFATALFNDWGVGDGERNDGVMVLVAVGDREMRVELGAGWPPLEDDRVKIVIDQYFTPWFARGEYARGIEAGTRELIHRLVPGFLSSGAEPAPGGGGGGSTRWIVLAFVALPLAFVAFRRRISDWLARCPRCGSRRFRRERRTVERARRGVAGREEILETCPECGWRDTRTRALPPIRFTSSGGGSGSFGGGRSSGGGASGRW